MIHHKLFLVLMFSTFCVIKKVMFSTLRLLTCAYYGKLISFLSTHTLPRKTVAAHLNRSILDFDDKAHRVSFAIMKGSIRTKEMLENY